MCKIYEILSSIAFSDTLISEFLQKLHAHPNFESSNYSMHSEYLPCPSPTPSTKPWAWQQSTILISRSSWTSPLNSPSDWPSLRRLCTWGKGGRNSNDFIIGNSSNSHFILNTIVQLVSALLLILLSQGGWLRCILIASSSCRALFPW